MDGKLILEGELELLSPLHIGSGESDSTDLDVIKDNNEMPFITFTSFIGALKHHLADNYNMDNSIDEVFGYSRKNRDETESKGSTIVGSDLLLTQNAKHVLLTRDGIEINPKTGIVYDKAKYDYQIVDRGTKFFLRIESSYSVSSKESILKYFVTIIDMLNDDSNNNLEMGLRIGAKTNNGLGKIRLNREKLFDYDFAQKDDVIAWLRRKDVKVFDYKEIKSFERKQEDLIIDAYLDLKTSIIQRSYNDHPSMPDASHIQSNEKDILTGSGTKGAIAGRAKRIINTIWPSDESAKKKFVDGLFGFVDNKNTGQKPVKAKLQIEERELPAYVAELQSRIKIDRFTGGTITGALFDSMPLFNSKELAMETDIKKKCTRLTIRVKNCEEAEAGIMLLVLKDIWTGDLAIGGEKGIGRGVFNGIYAFIKYKKETIELKKGLENLAVLQKYVDALVFKAGGKMLDEMKSPNEEENKMGPINGLEMLEIKTEATTVSAISNLNEINKYIKSYSYVVAYLDYKVLIGSYSSGSFNFPVDKLDELKYIQRMRIFNKNEELLIWRSNGEWKGRYRKDDINGKGTNVVDNNQVLFGTRYPDEKHPPLENLTIITEDRGTEIKLPFKVESLDEKKNKKNRVKIKTRNYIDFNETHQATYVDSRFIEFTFGEKNDPIGGVK